jgi:hypothetical protein
MMIIGNPDRFSVEFSVDQTHDSLLIGRLCYQVSRDRVGDYDHLCDLNSAVGGFVELSKGKGHRYDRTLMSQEAEIAFSEINRHLFIDYGQSDQEAQEDWKRFRRFIAKPIGLDLFDGWKCFLVEDERRGRFLWKDLRQGGNPPVRECVLSAGEFDSVLSLFIAHMESEYPEYIFIG